MRKVAEGGTRSTRRARVLLVSHEGSRTGAPRIAALVARSLVEAQYDLRIVVRQTGPLASEFAAIAPTTTEPFFRLRRKIFHTPILRHIAHFLHTLVALGVLMRHSSEVVYLNSTASSAYVRPARWLRKRVILHAHESKEWMTTFFDRHRAWKGLPDIELIACSPSTRDALAEITGRDDIALLPSVPDSSAVLRDTERDMQQEQRQQPLVGACGQAQFRKGTDLWIKLAGMVRAALPQANVRFEWVGEIAEPEVVSAAQGVEFLGGTSNPFSRMRQFDVFTLPSRDDPFPLVVLESMLLGVPVVAFDVGGVRTQIGDAGIVVEAGDLDAFAAAVIQLLTDVELRKSLGAAAARRARELYTTEAFAAGVRTLMDRSTAVPAENTA